MLQTFRRVRRATLSLTLVSGLLVAACSTSTATSGPDTGNTSTASSAIINGTADTTHQAVVFVYDQGTGNTGAACSGTIVKVDPTSKVGWVLTAAHCVLTIPPTVVVQGDDYSSPSALVYEVIDYAADPGYDPSNVGSSNDFAVIRVAGADSTTPVIQMASSPDGVTTGETVTSVGYGKTTTDPNAPDNTVRHKVTKTLQTVSSTQISYSIATSGICQGDSGGPVLANVGGTEKVVGVHSYVTGNCDGSGYSDRVTSGASWIATQLAKAPPADDCHYCETAAFSGNQPCAQKQRSCEADAQCKGYYDCFTACAQGDTSCVAACSTKYPLGEGPFDALAQCSCNVACVSECAGLNCSALPKCGYAYPKGTCKTCVEGSCCSQMQACAQDGQCFVCLKGGDSDPSCATNKLRQALASCQSDNCADACNGVSTSGGSGSTDPSAGDDAGTDNGNNGGGGGTRTITKSGCSAAGGDGAPTDAASLALVLGLGLWRGARRRSRISARRGRSARRS